MIILLVVVIVIFAIIGMMEGVFFISIIMQRSMQSHIHMLQKASLTEQFIVEDLCGENGCRSVRLGGPHGAGDSAQASTLREFLLISGCGDLRRHGMCSGRGCAGAT